MTDVLLREAIDLLENPNTRVDVRDWLKSARAEVPGIIQSGMKNTNSKTDSARSAAAKMLGRLGGKAGTPAQNRARQKNAKFAGRPRRVCTHCGKPVIGGHKDPALDEACGQHGWKWQKPSER